MSIINNGISGLNRYCTEDEGAEPSSGMLGKKYQCIFYADEDFQMRRAVRDYKFEVNEGRMTEECIQYLTQLQKDWERHRVKMGVEDLRKEVRIPSK